MKKLVENIIALRKNRGFKQSVIANAIGKDNSNWAKVEQGRQAVQVDDLENIANCLGVRVIDLFTYPDIYVRETPKRNERCSVTFEVSPEKRDHLLSLVMNDSELKS